MDEIVAVTWCQMWLYQAQRLWAKLWYKRNSIAYLKKGAGLLDMSSHVFLFQLNYVNALNNAGVFQSTSVDL